jgi:hypothetical protein
VYFCFTVVVRGAGRGYNGVDIERGDHVISSLMGGVIGPKYGRKPSFLNRLEPFIPFFWPSLQAVL